MLREYEKQDWFQLYQNAVIELEHVKMTGRIRDARAGITARLELLKGIPGLHEQERGSLADALSILTMLEREEQRFEAEERKRLADESLKKIKPLASKIRGL